MEFPIYFIAACLVVAVDSQEKIKILEISCRDFKYQVTWSKLPTLRSQAVSYTLLKLERRRTIEIPACTNLTTTSCTMTTNLHYLHLDHGFQVRAMMPGGKIVRSDVVYYIPLDGKFTLSPPRLGIERNGRNLTVFLSESVIPWLGKTVTEVLEKYRSDFEIQYYADVNNRTNHTFWTKKNRTTLITSVLESQKLCVRSAIKYERWGENRTGEWVKKCIPGLTVAYQYSKKWHIALLTTAVFIFILACGLVLGCTPVGRKAYRYMFSIRKVTIRPSIVVDIDNAEASDGVIHPNEVAEKTPEKIFKKLYVQRQNSSEGQAEDQTEPLIPFYNAYVSRTAERFGENEEILDANNQVEHAQDDLGSEDSFQLLKQTLSLQSYITEDDLRRMKLKENERMELQGACVSSTPVCEVTVTNDNDMPEGHPYVNESISVADNHTDHLLVVETTDSVTQEALAKSEKLRLNSEDSAFFEDADASLRTSLTSAQYENLPRTAVKECQTSPGLARRNFVFNFGDGYEQMTLNTNPNNNGRFPGPRYQNTAFRENELSPYISLDS